MQATCLMLIKAEFMPNFLLSVFLNLSKEDGKLVYKRMNRHNDRSRCDSCRTFVFQATLALQLFHSLLLTFLLCQFTRSTAYAMHAYT